MRSKMRAVAAFGAVLALPAFAQYAPPKITNGVRIEQKLNTALPLSLPFRDEQGHAVTLDRYFGRRPVVIVPVYYRCPSLCNVTLNSAVKSLNRLTLLPGRDYEVVVFSFNPAETTELARNKKASYAAVSSRAFFNEGWHFLTGSQESISRLTDAIGFRYRWDEATKQFVHGGGIMLATPGGRLAKYFYGEVFPSADVRLALVEASNGKIGSPVDQFLLFCFHYDFVQGRYTLQIVNLLRVLGILTVVLLVGFILLMRRRDLKLGRAGSRNVEQAQHVH